VGIDPAQMERYFGMVTSIKSTFPETTLATNTVTPASATPLAVGRGVLLQAHPDNTGRIRVGGPNVDATHGLVLGAGTVLFLACDDVSDLSLWTSDANQRFNGIVI
jgi:hypothetical protein